MGNSPPHLIKFEHADKSTKFPLYYVCSYVRGIRGEQEDAHILEKELTYELNGVKKETNLAYFGVFDGHSGGETSDFISKHLVPDYLFKDENPTDLPNEDNEEKLGDYITNKDRISRKFLECDQHILDNRELQNAGSTGVSVFFKYRKNDNCFELLCANVGDSRAVQYDAGEVKALSTDHKPSLPQETQRIEKAGHFVTADRVDGQLALSRSFGDKKYKISSNNDPKLKAVIADPEFSDNKICLDAAPKEGKSPYKFVLIGCDGVWDVLKNNEACEFVAKYLDKFDIFNPEVKVPSYYHEPAMMQNAKQKGDDWVYTPIEFWSNDQYDQWEHTIPSPYPVFNGCYSVLSLVKIIRDQLANPENNYEETNPQLKKLRKMYNNIMQVKEHHDKMEKLWKEKPVLTTVEEKLTKIAELFLDEVVLTKRSNDNVSIIIVLMDNQGKLTEIKKTSNPAEFENEHKMPFDLESKAKDKADIANYLSEIKTLLEKFEKPKEKLSPVPAVENKQSNEEKEEKDNDTVVE